jgi:hypothetical protein
MIEPDEDFEWVETISDDDGDDYEDTELMVCECDTCLTAHISHI